MSGRHLRILVLSLVLCAIALGSVPGIAGATSWYVTDAQRLQGCRVVRESPRRFTVRDDSGAKMGAVVKSASGKWQVTRNGRQLATLKTRRLVAHQVDMMKGGGRIGLCRRTNNGEELCMAMCSGRKIIGWVGFAPIGCPLRAAMGAARLAFWR